MAAITKLDEATLQALCDVPGATDTGLTGSEIGRYLKELAQRLFEAASTARFSLATVTPRPLEQPQTCPQERRRACRHSAGASLQ